jgi:hypothetical protein
MSEERLTPEEAAISSQRFLISGFTRKLIRPLFSMTCFSPTSL